MDPTSPGMSEIQDGKNGPPAARRRALALIDEGNALTSLGRIAEAMTRYDSAVHADPSCAPAHLSRGNTLLTMARLEEARRAYQTAIACDPQYAAAHFNLGNLNYRAAEFAEALREYQATAAITPQHADAFVGMGNALHGLGRSAEAHESYQRALLISPGHADAHVNLGVLAMTQERLPEAAASLRRAIELRPADPRAPHLLGALLNRMNDHEGAEASLRRAASLAPEAPAILYDLAVLLQARGEHAGALPLLTRALERTPNWATKAAFATCVAHMRFSHADSRLRELFTAAVTEGWAMPTRLCDAGLSLVILDGRIARAVRRANEAWPARVPPAQLFGADGLAALGSDTLLLALLESVPLHSLEVERFLTSARRALLDSAADRKSSGATDPSALRFYAALARQCFINEYIFDCPDEEQQVFAACRARVGALLDAKATIPAVLVIAVAAYSPLYELPNAEALLTATEPGAADEVLRQQVREPLEERALRSCVPSLTPISEGVSTAVRELYEENPYPRWSRLERREDGLRFNAELRRVLPAARFVPMADDSAPEMLVAGCGTGSDTILFCQRFRGVRVLAVDLSLRSISFAMRKARELGMTNIEHAQADILALGGIERTFDIIASVGVLHHLADPFEGWRILLSRLRLGGFMCVGLYSRSARSTVTRAREFVASRGYASTPAAIRQFRQDVAALDPGDDLKRLTQSKAFYSMSECRDLAFHVQEHQLTLGQIEAFLAENRLRFIGFELGAPVLSRYRAAFADDPTCTNLRNWAQFEAANADTFTAMYQFWVQRQ
jgi:tetratricopeptide (TPR) repeat protein/SAM-dependent methyltransferase